MFTPVRISTYTYQGVGYRGIVVSLGLWKAISAMRRGRLYALMETNSMCRELQGVGMEFYIGGYHVAEFVGANLGALVADGFNGGISWS